MSSDRREPSEKTLTVVDIPGCGLGLQAVRTLESGTVVLQESPIAILRSTSLHKAFATDGELRRYSVLPAAAQGCSPYADEQWWPAPARASEQVIKRFAELEFAKLSHLQQVKWMSLVDSFSPPSVGQPSPGNVVRSNAFTNSATGDNYLFELLCRANHSCAPNLSRSFQGDMVLVKMLRRAAKGEALCLSYLSEADLGRPTEERRELLHRRFNFLCECTRCGPVGEAPSCDALDVEEALVGTEGASIEGGEDVVDVCDSTQGPLPGLRTCAAGTITAAQAAVSAQLHACTAQLRSVAPGSDVQALLASMGACAEALQSLERAQRDLSD
jgi:hypothetical protein